MKLSELIVKVLDVAGKRLEEEAVEPEVLLYATAIKQRYAELKGKHDYMTAAFLARVEFVRRIIEAERDIGE